MDSTLDKIIEEHAALEARLGDPAAQADQFAYLELSRRYAEVGRVASVARDLRDARQSLAEARELLADPDLADLARADLDHYAARVPELEAEFERLTLPKDPADERNVIVEIRAGTGGAEAALFAADLYRLYLRRAEELSFRVETLDVSESEIGGFSRVTFQVLGHGAYSQFKYESGVHRVQRVPATEAAGRIHTSTATVAVLPEAEEVDFKLDMSEVRIDVYRSSGPGGQSVNTTDSAVRVTYRPGTPDELIVTSQDGKSQIKNKERALTVLRSRLYEKKRQEEMERQRQTRLSQIGTGERSEKIRTYNFPQSRITDHRVNFTTHQLPTVLNGDLAELLD
ncbi:MAG TPA: peptide chain release factor 1, partial [Deinococcales bacterium]|nr:peptide chain release factor 1 [Deinococcales bacterium]